MVANILSAAPLDPGGVVKMHDFLKMGILHIKLKGVMNAATW